MKLFILGSDRSIAGPLLEKLMAPLDNSFIEARAAELWDFDYDYAVPELTPAQIPFDEIPNRNLRALLFLATQSYFPRHAVDSEQRGATAALQAINGAV